MRPKRAKRTEAPPLSGRPCLAHGPGNSRAPRPTFNAGTFSALDVQVRYTIAWMSVRPRESGPARGSATAQSTIASPAQKDRNFLRVCREMHVVAACVRWITKCAEPTCVSECSLRVRKPTIAAASSSHSVTLCQDDDATIWFANLRPTRLYRGGNRRGGRERRPPGKPWYWSFPRTSLCPRKRSGRD